MNMKKVLILLTVFSLLISTIVIGDQKVQAGAVKTVYKSAQGTSESIIKSMEARNGVKLWEGIADPATRKIRAKETTNIIAKGIQDGAKGAGVDAWDTISGSKLSKTPLKGMPGWSKVIIGTGLFISGADIVLDLFETSKDNPNKNFETIMPYSEATTYNPISSHPNSGIYRIDSIAGWNVDWVNSEGLSAVELTIPNHGVFIVKGKYPMEQFTWTMPLYIQINTNGSAINVFWEHPDPKISYTYSIVEQWNGSGYDYFITSTSTSLRNLWDERIRRTRYDVSNPSHQGDNAPKNHGVLVPVKAPQLEKYETPVIDKNKANQVLIIPEPGFHPDIDLAIDQNRDMVSDPETWLKNNPESDPNPGKEDLADPSPTDTEIDETIEKNKKGLEDNNRKWGALITTKFPFSLPFDLYYVLSFLSAEPRAPNFTIDESLNGLPFYFEVDMVFLDPYMGWFRTFIVLGFMFMLIMITRKLLGGAQ